MYADQVNAILALELFQLDPRSRQSRELLHQHLVEVALLNCSDPATEPKILEGITGICGGRTPLTEHQLHLALERCVSRVTVYKKPDQTYVLSAVTLTNLENQLTNHKLQEKSFYCLVVSEVEKAAKQTLSPLAEPVLVDAIARTLQALFYDNQLSLQHALSQGNDLGCLLESDFDPEQNLRQELQVFVTTYLPTQMEAVVAGVKNTFANLNTDHKLYLLRFLQQVFFFEILNLEPRLQDFERRCFQKTQLYLDTNVGIRFLCRHHPDYEVVATTIETSKALGCKLFVSPATLMEMVRLVTIARTNSALLMRDKVAELFAYEPRAADNPLIESYVLEKKGNRALAWSAFVARYDDIESLLLERDVLVEGDDSALLQNEPVFREVSAVVTSVKQVANQYVTLHDALNAVLIHKIRRKVPSTQMGPGVWLLTNDRSLPQVDRRLLHTFPVGHCHLLSRWSEVMFPFQGIAGTSFSGDYVAFLLSNRFGVYLNPSIIETNFLKTLLDDEVGIPELIELPPEIVMGVLKKVQESREARRLIEEPINIVDKSTEPEERRRQFVTLVAKYAAEAEAEAKKKEDDQTKHLKDGIVQLKATLADAQLQSARDNDLINSLKDKIGALDIALRKREIALKEIEAERDKSYQQLEAERERSWVVKLWRMLRGG